MLVLKNLLNQARVIKHADASTYAYINIYIYRCRYRHGDMFREFREWNSDELDLTYFFLYLSTGVFYPHTSRLKIFGLAAGSKRA